MQKIKKFYREVNYVHLALSIVKNVGWDVKPEQYKKKKKMYIGKCDTSKVKLSNMVGKTGSCNVRTPCHSNFA